MIRTGILSVVAVLIAGGSAFAHSGTSKGTLDVLRMLDNGAPVGVLASDEQSGPAGMRLAADDDDDDDGDDDGDA